MLRLSPPLSSVYLRRMARPFERYGEDVTVSLLVRMSERLRRQLAAAARANGRSLTSEVIWRLSGSFEAPTSIVRSAEALAEPPTLQSPPSSEPEDEVLDDLAKVVLRLCDDRDLT
jgi:hypothetical protein